MNWYSKVEQFRRDSIPPNYFNKHFKSSKRSKQDVSPSKRQYWLKELHEGIQGRRLSKSPTRIFVKKVWRQPMRSKSFTILTKKRLYRTNDDDYRRQSAEGDLYGLPSMKQKKINTQLTVVFVAWQMYLREKERLEKRRKAIKLKTMERLQIADKKHKKHKDKPQRALPVLPPTNERSSPNHREQIKLKLQQQTEIQMSEQAHQELFNMHSQNNQNFPKFDILPALNRPIITEEIKHLHFQSAVSPESNQQHKTKVNKLQENEKQLSKFHPSRQSTLKNIFQVGVRQSLRLKNSKVELPPLQSNVSPLQNSVMASPKQDPQTKNEEKKSPKQLSSTRSLKVPQIFSSKRVIPLKKSQYSRDIDSNVGSPERAKEQLSIQNLLWKINLVVWTDPKKLRILHGSIDDFKINYQFIEKPKTPINKLINYPIGSEKRILHNVNQQTINHHHKVTISKHKMDSRQPSNEDIESRCESSESSHNTIVPKKSKLNMKYKEILKDSRTLLEIMTQQSKLKSNRTMVNFIHRSPKSQLNTDASKIEQNSIVASSICQEKKPFAFNSTRTLGNSIANSHFCSSQYLSNKKLYQEDSSNRLTLLELHSQYKTQGELVLSAARKIKSIHSPEVSIKFARSRIETYL